MDPPHVIFSLIPHPSLERHFTEREDSGCVPLSVSGRERGVAARADCSVIKPLPFSVAARRSIRRRRRKALE